MIGTKQSGIVLEEEQSPSSGEFLRRSDVTQDRRAILEQLERVLASPSFRTSKRYPRFLRYVVNETLDGRADGVKERVIAVEVFNRPPEYDSNIDPIVRVAAGDIRKRIAQYYVEPGHETEIRIELHPGSYVPTFVWPERHRITSPEYSEGLAAAEPAPVPLFPSSSSRFRVQWTHRWRTSLVAAILCILLVLVSLLYTRLGPESNVQAFWSPFFSGPEPSLILLADILSVSGQPQPNEAADPTLLTWIGGANHVAYGDVNALVNVTGAFQRQRKRFRVLMASSVEFSELRTQPLVLIGGMDNPWATRFQNGMRYTFEPGPTSRSFWIRDAQSSDRSRWTMDFGNRLSSLTRDFAIVTRFTNESIEQPTMIVAGMGPYATTAAGEFVTNPQYFAEFARVAPIGWAHKNVQIVLETEVVHGQSGPPHMVAYFVW